jgi:hypothetical protein
MERQRKQRMLAHLQQQRLNEMQRTTVDFDVLPTRDEIENMAA